MSDELREGLEMLLPLVYRVLSLVISTILVSQFVIQECSKTHDPKQIELMTIFISSPFGSLVVLAVLLVFTLFLHSLLMMPGKAFYKY